MTLDFLRHGTNAETNFARRRFDFDDLGVEFLTHRDDFLGIGDFTLAELGKMNKALHTVFEFRERPEVGYLDDIHPHFLSDLILRFNKRPGVGFHLLKTERQTLIIFVNIKHHGTNALTLLEDFRRVLDPLRP